MNARTSLLLCCAVVSALASCDEGDDSLADASRGEDGSVRQDGSIREDGAVHEDASAREDASSPDGGGQHSAADCTLPFDDGDCDGLGIRFGYGAAGRCEPFAYGLCGGNANNFQTVAECESVCEVDCSVVAAHRSLLGVTVHIEGDACTVISGEHATFKYRIEIAEPIEYEQPASVGCGPCGDDHLVTFEIGRGLVRYNESDVGCCPPLEQSSKTLAAGAIEGEIDWPGVQWRGPSDTNQPLGPRFPGSHYDVRVTIDVPGKGSVVAALPIVVAPPLELLEPSEPLPCASDTYVYPSGDSTFPDPTSCNTCTCEAGIVTACEDRACPVDCPSGSAVGSDCGECGPIDTCRAIYTGCLPTCSGDEPCSNGGVCSDGLCTRLCGG